MSYLYDQVIDSRRRREEAANKKWELPDNTLLLTDCRDVRRRFTVQSV